MTNVMEVQQELISRLMATCRAVRRVPDEAWLASTLRPGGPEELVGLLRTVYPYADSFAELPPVQRELLVERVRGGIHPARRRAAAVGAGTA